MMRAAVIVAVLLGLLLPAMAMAQTPNNISVTIGSGTPSPNPASTNQGIRVAYNLSVSAPQAIKDEITRDGVVQVYTIQFSDDGIPKTVTLLGRTLAFSDKIGNFTVTFLPGNRQIEVSSNGIKTGILTSIEVTGAFSSSGDKQINFDGTVQDGTISLSTNNGGHAVIQVIDFHLRADTNHDGTPTDADDATSDLPGLFVPLNSGTTGPVHMKLNPLPPATNSGYTYPRYVRITRTNTNCNVWRGQNKTAAVLVADLKNRWDLTIDDSRQKFIDSKEDLWVEGVTGGDTKLTLELIANDESILLTSTLAVHTWGIEIQVNNATTQPATRPAVVCRRSTSPVGYPEIPCQARVVGTGPATTVYISNGSETGGQLKFGTTAGQARSDSISLNLPAGGGDWTGFFISGETWSSHMGDAIIQARQNDAQGAIVGQAQATVLWVTIARRSAATDIMSADNAARLEYYSQSVPGTYNLGWHKLWDRFGWGMEFVGTVYPSDFSGKVKLDRDNQFKYYWNDGATEVPVDSGGSKEFNVNIPPGGDPSLVTLRSDTPPVIYDCDASGLVTDVKPKDFVWRKRANYKEFAKLVIDGSQIRCSDDLCYWLRVSMRQNAPGVAADWVLDNHIANDNQTGSGTTNLGFDATN